MTLFRLPFVLIAVLAATTACHGPDRPAAGPVGLVRFANLSRHANSVIFVVDMTGQARGSAAHRYMLADLDRSLESLAPTQRFGLVLFGATGADCLAPNNEWTLLPATRANIEAAQACIRGHRENGTLDEGACWRAVDMAFRFKPPAPDVIFLVATRPWAQAGLADRIRTANHVGRRSFRSQIDTVGFVNPDIKPSFERIAADNGGQFQFIEAVDLGAPSEPR